MSLVRRPGLQVQGNVGTSNALSSSSESIYSVHQNGLDATADDRENRDFYMLLSRECAGGWNPSFKHGQAAVKSIADCVRCVADENHARLKVVYFPFQEDSPEL